MQKYRILGKKGEGTFSEVLKVQDIQDGTYFACKKMKQRYESIDQVNNLREIQAMRRLNPHGNVVDLKDIIFDKKSGTLALICELMDMNLYEMIRGRRHYISESKVKNYMYRAPECLLTDGYYTYKMDMWSVGCVFFEVLSDSDILV
ncbi:MAPK/MAK/MRK overlapping kinase [Acropora cervicornis]|uniref:MAPK/MAK/MRK overlapping kinase n=1 Tax=Acropora cervicornis TaxID=6130 RepID=A0AAD9Q465_ACRCE|nr:MAPK/MAK/MRK overlapping kinase [Acropora cervicornis]